MIKEIAAAILVSIMFYYIYKGGKKMDDKKKKKQDGKRIALGQKHERDYLKNIAKDLLNKIGKSKCRIFWLDFNGEHKQYSLSSLRRITKALIKYLKNDKR